MKVNKTAICALCVFLIAGCSKHQDDNYRQSDSYLTYFESLTAEKDTIFRGESTIITANAAGNKITYTWTASEGPVLK